MSNKGKVKVGIIGSQFEADIHAASFQIASEGAEVVAVASPTPGNAAALANRYGIPRVFTDYREMLKERDIEMVTLATPNGLHAQMTEDCARAGKHVVCEKPLAMTLEQCEQMIDVTRRAGVLLLYAEELFSHLNIERPRKWPRMAPSDVSTWSSRVKSILVLIVRGSGTSISAGAAH
jgi:predicted dehydrogenase